MKSELSAIRGRHGRDGPVELHPTMTQAERRSALAHELVHDERAWIDEQLEERPC